MPTSLFHGTRQREIIENVDPARAGSGGASSEHGIGFYTRPIYQNPRYPHETSYNGTAYGVGEVAGWGAGGRGGVIYRIDVPENFDTMGREHQQRFLTSSVPVDETLINRLSAGMRAVGKDPVSGRDFSAAADELESRWKKGHYKDFNTKELVIQLQSEYGVPSSTNAGAKTSTDVFHKAGIAGMHAQTNDSVVILDPAALSKPKPHAIYIPGNESANEVGKILDQLNSTKGLSPSADENLRKMVVQATFDTESGKASSYDQVRKIRSTLESSGVPLSDEIKQQLTKAENATGKIAGLSPEKIQAGREGSELREKAQALVDARPGREKGEGFEHYKDRVFNWYDTNNPKPTEAQSRAFNSALNDTLYREAQQHYANVTGDALAIKNDPAKVERLLADNRTESRTLQGVAHVEMDAGTYHNSSEFNASRLKTPGASAEGAHAGKLGKAAGVVGFGIGIGAAAGHASAAENRKPEAADYAKAAYNQSPVAPLVEGKYAEAAVRTVEMLDPTMGVASSAARRALRENGAQVEEGMSGQIASPTAANKRELNINANRAGFLAREQTAYLQDAGLLEIKDAMGKRVDVAAILRDPQQRDGFIKQLQDNAANATNPNIKESFNHMAEAAQKFVSMEPERDALVKRNNQIMAELAPKEPGRPPVQPQAAGPDRAAPKV